MLPALLAWLLLLVVLMELMVVRDDVPTYPTSAMPRP